MGRGSRGAPGAEGGGRQLSMAPAQTQHLQPCRPGPRRRGQCPSPPPRPLGAPSPERHHDGTRPERSRARCAHSLERVRVFLQEGDGGRGVAGDILVGELHELADEGGQVAGGLPVVLQREAQGGEHSGPEASRLARIVPPGASQYRAWTPPTRCPLPGSMLRSLRVRSDLVPHEP